MCRGETAAALPYAERAYMLNNNDVNALMLFFKCHMLIGGEFARNGDIDSSRRHLDIASMLSSCNEMLVDILSRWEFTIALELFDKGHIISALPYASRAYELRNNAMTANTLLCFKVSVASMLYKGGLFLDSLKYLEEAYSIDYKNVEIYPALRNLAVHFFKVGMFNEAIKCYNMLWGINNNSAYLKCLSISQRFSKLLSSGVKDIGSNISMLDVHVMRSALENQGCVLKVYAL